MTNTTLKLIAMALMLLDHLHTFLPDMPLWFTWLGRISAPLFIFSMTWGIFYTHDRKAYVWRLYLFGLVMAAGDLVLWLFVENPMVDYITNNIMVTLLLTTYLIIAIEFLRGERKDRKRGWWMLVALVLVQIASMGVIYALGPVYGGDPVRGVISAVLPNLLFCEGSIFFVFYGVALYYVRNVRIGLILVNVLIAAFFLLLGWPKTAEQLFSTDFQWMMIAALPLMLTYNGKKGQGYKWLFYVFYPVHIFLLYWLGGLLI